MASIRYRDQLVTWPLVHDDVIKWKHFPRYWTFAGNSPIPGEILPQRPVTRSFDIFFDLRLNTPLSKYSVRWCFETPSFPLSRHCNAQDQEKSTNEVSRECGLVYKYTFNDDLVQFWFKLLDFVLQNMPSKHTIWWSSMACCSNCFLYFYSALLIRHVLNHNDEILICSCII